MLKKSTIRYQTYQILAGYLPGNHTAVVETINIL